MPQHAARFDQASQVHCGDGAAWREPDSPALMTAARDVMTPSRPVATPLATLLTPIHDNVFKSVRDGEDRLNSSPLELRFALDPAFAATLRKAMNPPRHGRGSVARAVQAAMARHVRVEILYFDGQVPSAYVEAEGRMAPVDPPGLDYVVMDRTPELVLKVERNFPLSSSHSGRPFRLAFVFSRAAGARPSVTVTRQFLVMAKQPKAHTQLKPRKPKPPRAPISPDRLATFDAIRASGEAGPAGGILCLSVAPGGASPTHASASVPPPPSPPVAPAVVPSASIPTPGIAAAVVAVGALSGRDSSTPSAASPSQGRNRRRGSRRTKPQLQQQEQQQEEGVEEPLAVPTAKRSRRHSPTTTASTTTAPCPPSPPCATGGDRLSLPLPLPCEAMPSPLAHLTPTLCGEVLPTPPAMSALCLPTALTDPAFLQGLSVSDLMADFAADSSLWEALPTSTPLGHLCEPQAGAGLPPPPLPAPRGSALDAASEEGEEEARVASDDDDDTDDDDDDDVDDDILVAEAYRPAVVLPQPVVRRTPLSSATPALLPCCTAP